MRLSEFWFGTSSNTQPLDPLAFPPRDLRRRPLGGIMGNAGAPVMRWLGSLFEEWVAKGLFLDSVRMDSFGIFIFIYIEPMKKPWAQRRVWRGPWVECSSLPKMPGGWLFLGDQKCPSQVQDHPTLTQSLGEAAVGRVCLHFDPKWRLILRYLVRGWMSFDHSRGCLRKVIVSLGKVRLSSHSYGDLGVFESPLGCELCIGAGVKPRPPPHGSRTSPWGSGA